MDNQIRKFYDSDATGGSVDWYSEYTEASKEIKRLNEKLAALQPSNLPLIDKGEQRTFWDKVWDISMQAPSEDDFTDTCEKQFTINKKQ